MSWPGWYRRPASSAAVSTRRCMPGLSGAESTTSSHIRVVAASGPVSTANGSFRAGADSVMGGRASWSRLGGQLLINAPRALVLPAGAGGLTITSGERLTAHPEERPHNLLRGAASQ